MLVREYAMNTTGMSREWIADSDGVWQKLPSELPITKPMGCAFIEQAYESARGGIYLVSYELTLRDTGEFIGRLKDMTCLMPPRPPQILGYGDDVRLPMMDKYGFSAALEAEQRVREWAEIAAQESVSA